MIRPIELPSFRAPEGLSSASPAPQSRGASFADVLAQQVRPPGSVTFSRHAAERLDARQIALSPADKAGLEKAVDEVAAKGGRESLVLMGRLAFVVSVPNRTVITAVPTDQMANHVFTNIDSTVVVPR
jgi:flagellar operon protein